MNRTDLQKISKIRLTEGQRLYDAGFYCGAYYLTGYAIECAFKAAISKQINAHDFPDKKLVNDSHTHDLKKLLDTSGLKTRLETAIQANPALELNWSIVKDWSERTRYRHDLGQASARDLIDACITQPNGVYPWLTNLW